MYCILLFISTIASKEVQICICQGLDCQQYAGCSQTNTLDPVDDLTSKDFYDRVQSLMIGCTDVNLIIRRSSASFVPELRLIQFTGKNVRVTESTLGNAPREGVRFQYSDDEDYSRIQLVSINAKIIFTPLNASSDAVTNLTLYNFFLIESSYSTVEFGGKYPQVSTNTITNSDYSIILSKYLIFNQILLNTNDVKLYIDNGQCQVQLHNDYFDYSISSSSISVHYPSNQVLNLLRDGEDPGIMFLSNVDITDYTKIPKITTTNIDEIGISGAWPDPTTTSFDSLISIGDDKTDTKISVISQKVPFNLYARNLELTIISSTTFVGQIEARTVTLRRTTEGVAYIEMPKLTSDLKIVSPNISLVIDDYTYTGYGIPTTVSFSEKNISKVTVNKFTTSNSIIDNVLSVSSLLNSQTLAPKIVELFENQGNFLVLPYQSWMDASDIIINYDQSSSDRDGFTNEFNIVEVKVTKKDDKAVFSFHLTSTPTDSPLEYNVCFNNLCDASSPIIGNVQVSEYLTEHTDYVFTVYNQGFADVSKFIFTSISSGEYNFVIKSAGANLPFIEIESDEQSSSHIKSITLSGSVRVKSSTIYATTINVVEQAYLLNNPVLKAPNINVDSTVDADFLAGVINQANSPLKKLVINTNTENQFKLTVSDSKVSFKVSTNTNVELPLKSSYALSFLTKNVAIDSSIQNGLTQSFSVDFNENSQVTLNGFSNSASSSSAKVKLNHGDNELEVIYDINSNVDSNFQFIGHGYVSRNINYGTVTQYCLCYQENDANCQKCSSSTKLYYESFAANIPESVHNVKLTIQEPATGSATPVLPVSLFENRKFEIDSTNDVTLKLKLEQIGSSTNVNVKITGSINLQPDTTTTGTELRLGVFDIQSLSGSISGFGSNKLTVDKLYIMLSQINQFQSIEILDEIKVKVSNQDTNPTFEKTVKINEGTDFYDLTIDFEFNQQPFTFTFGNGYMKLGNVQFTIARTEYIDIVVNPAVNFNFNINLDRGADVNQVPLARFNMNHEFGLTRSVYFNENWAGSTNQILSFVVGNSVSFYFKSLVPMGVQFNKFVPHNFYINSATAINVGIQFDITIDQNLGSNVNTYEDGFHIYAGDDLQSSRTFCFRQIRFLHRCESFSINSNSPKASLSVNNIVSYNSERVNVNVKLQIDATTTGSLTVENTLSQASLNSVLVEALIDNTADFDKIAVLNRNVTVVNGRYNNLHELLDHNLIKYINSAEHPAYGTSTTSDVIGFTISDDQRSINLGRLREISESTFVAQYERSGNTEIIKDVSLVLTDSRNIIPVLSQTLPKQVKSVYLYITDNLFGTDVIDFTKFQSDKFENKIDFILDGVSLRRYTAPIVLGPIINTLTITNLNLLVPELAPSSSKIIKDDQTSIELIKFVDSSVPDKSLSIDSTVKSIESDTDSFSSLLNNQIIQDSYQGKLKLTSSNYITFTKDGWIVQESSWKTPVHIKSDSKLSDRIQFEAYDEVSLLIDPSAENMTEVKRPDLSVVSTKGDDKVTVHVGTGWRQITNAKDLNINAGKNELDIYTATYPLDNMFNTDNFSVSLGTSAGQPDGSGSGSGSQVDFNLGDEYVLKDSQNIDMSSISNENDRVIRAKLIRCSGTGKLSFTNDLGHVRAEQVIVQDGAYAQLPQTTVSNSIEMIEGSVLEIGLLHQPNQGIDFKWRHNKMPEMEILSNERITYTPSITVTFNSDETEEQLNKTFYNELLVNTRFNLVTGKFDCEDWKRNAKFSSSIEKFSSNSGDNCFFQFQCVKSRNNDVLQVRATNLFDMPKPSDPNENITSGPSVPTPDVPSTDGDSTNTDKEVDPKPKNSLSTGAIVGIVLACAVVAAALCGFVVYIVIRKKYEKQLDDNIELAEGNNTQSVSSTANI